MNKLIPFAAAVVALMIAGCGGDDTTVVGRSPRIRALNAVYKQDVLVQFTETDERPALQYGGLSPYVISDNEEQNVRFVDPTTRTVFASAPGTLFRNNTYYTVVGVGGSANDREAFVIEDREFDDPDNDEINVRFVHAAKHTGVDNVDVFFVRPDTDITNLAPDGNDVDYKEATDYRSYGQGNWEVIVRTQGGRVLGRETVNLAGGENYTVFILSNDLTNGGAETTQVVAYAEGASTED
ncbi:MAG TPA: DUF4397 domain-containing protein [Fimbriimonas sp.]